MSDCEHLHFTMPGFQSYLRQRSRPVIAGACLFTVVLVGLADYLSGYEISFSIFYLVAVSVATWFVGFGFGLFISVLSVMSWLLGDLAAGATYSTRFVPGWNAVIAFAFYVVMVRVLATLRTMHDHLERMVAQRTVALTEEMAKREMLEKELLAVSEREQRRIGHDLHDSLCQHLTGTALACQVLGDKLDAMGLPEAADAGHVVTLVEEGITLARSLARGLAPVELGAEGLMAALRELAKNASERFKVNCTFEAPEFVPIDDPSTAIHLFRIAQEAISNAIKHGRATCIVIALSVSPGGVRLSITDDGVGLAEPLPVTQGMGLNIMRHRSAIIGASFDIRRIGCGTRVQCTSPVLDAAPTP